MKGGRFGDDVLSTLRTVVSVDDLPAYNRARAEGYVKWTKSPEGRKYLEDMKAVDTHCRRIAEEYMGGKVWKWKLP